MKKLFSKNFTGFSLIEILIVIGIITILMAVFIPSISKSPEASRDSRRMADLERIKRILLAAQTDGLAYPTTDGCISNDGAAVSGSSPAAGLNFSQWLPYFGGTVPLDPLSSDTRYYHTTLTNVRCANGRYFYEANPGGLGTFSFVLLANVEGWEGEGFVQCRRARLDGLFLPLTETTATNNRCYALFVE